MEYKLSNGKIHLIVSSYGAELQSVKKDNIEYLWDGNEEYWPDRAPVLFPFVGRFTEGKYTLNGKTFEMDIHGFAKQSDFQLVEQKQDKLILELRDSKKTIACYPFCFKFNVEYHLKENVIDIRFVVENCSEETMYFGIGGHPGFRVPLEKELSFSDYMLEFGGESRPERVGHTDQCFLSGKDEEFVLEDGKILRLEHSLFDEDAIVLRNMSDEVTLRSNKGKRKVTVKYPDCRYLGIWHAPKTKAGYVCIEPWTSIPSRQDIIEEFRYKSDLIRLNPDETYVNQWSISIE